MSYKVELLVYGESKWYGNGLRFATREQAEAFGLGKFTAWTQCEDYRVVESDEPVTEPVSTVCR